MIKFLKFTHFQSLIIFWTPLFFFKLFKTETFCFVTFKLKVKILRPAILNHCRVCTRVKLLTALFCFVMHLNEILVVKY